MSNSIELYSKLNNPIEAITQIGHMFARSGMFGCEREEQGHILAMICLAEHKSPVQITRDFDIVDGKLRKKAMAAYADFRSKGGKVKWLKTGDDGIEAQAQISFEDQTITVSFTIEQAKQQGLVRPKSNWEKTPGNMLRARVVSNAIGMLCPEIYAGDDTESDSAPREPQSLNLQPAAATAAPAAPTAEPKPATVVEVKTVSQDEKEEAKMGLAPEAKAKEVIATLEAVREKAESAMATTPPPAAPAQDKFAAGPKYEAPRGAQLSTELASQVEQAIGAQAPQAMKWMIKEGWLQSGQDISMLTEARARRIIKQRDTFLKAIAEAQ